MADRLLKFYRMDDKRVRVIRPALPTHIQTYKTSQYKGYSPRLASSSGIRLLFLATYYAHKNHAILPALISELRKRKLTGKVHFFLTLDGNRRRGEVTLLRKLESEQDLVTNLGRLQPEEVGPVLYTADALFLPTLVETFGLIYLEALAFGTPILTSDRDFARYVCGDLALYFDPLDPVSIANTIEFFLEESSNWKKLVKGKAPQQLDRISQSDEENAEAFLRILRQAEALQRIYT